MAHWVGTPNVLNEFSYAQGWNSANYYRTLSDIDHSSWNGGAPGKHSSDYIGFGAGGVEFGFGGKDANGNAIIRLYDNDALHDFGTSQGYSSINIRGVDTYGYGYYFWAKGLNPIVYEKPVAWGQGGAGVIFYRPDDSTPHSNSDGYDFSPNFQGLSVYRDFGTSQGWNEHYNFQIVNTGSTTPDILGFGSAGLLVGPQAFAPGHDASEVYLSGTKPDQFYNSSWVGNGNGWDSVRDIRTFKDSTGSNIDLNKDGVPDFIGFGPDGLQYAFGAKDQNGYFNLSNPNTAHVSGLHSDFGASQGWSNAETPRFIQDINEDGRVDIVAFGVAGAVVALGQDPGTGEAFGQEYLGISDFGIGQGWSSGSMYPRHIADINGDRIPDIVGFGQDYTLVALGAKDTAGHVTWQMHQELQIRDFGYSEGWRSDTTFRGLNDVDGDGVSELIVSGAAGTHIYDLMA